jgi:hypothetical protein
MEKAKARIKMTLRMSGRVRLHALVEGGFLLPPFVSPTAFLLDSNAVSIIQEPSKMIPEERDWWQSLLASKETVLNVFPKAFEGNTGSAFPTLEDFKAELIKDVREVAELFPDVTLIQLNESDIEKVYDLVSGSASYGDAEIRFLLDAAPLVTQHVAPRAFEAVEAKIFDFARQHGLRSDSLSLLLVVATMYGRPQAEDIARRVLKPAQIVKLGSAHNAFADINLIRMFIAGLALSRDLSLPSFALLTADRPLIALWCGLEFKNIRTSPEGHGMADFVFSSKIFPSLSEEKRLELVERIASI